MCALLQSVCLSVCLSVAVCVDMGNVATADSEAGVATEHADVVRLLCFVTLISVTIPCIFIPTTLLYSPP